MRRLKDLTFFRPLSSLSLSPRLNDFSAASACVQIPASLPHAVFFCPFLTEMGNFLPTDAFHADGPLLHGLFAIRARSAPEPSSEAEPEPKWPNFRRSTQSNKHGQRARCSKCTYGLRISNASRSALEFLDGRNGGAKAEFLHPPNF